MLVGILPSGERSRAEVGFFIKEAKMLYVPAGFNTFGLHTPSWGTTRPSATFMTSVTPAVGSFGSWYQVGSDLAYDCYGVLIAINNNFASAAGRNTMLNVGVDLAGGTSFTSVIPDLICGSVDSYIAGGRSGNGAWYYFPLFIPAVASVGVQAQGTVATAFYCGMMFLHKPLDPSHLRLGSFAEAIGYGTRPNGTSITPGTTSEGAWTSLGTTTKKLWWWQLGMQIPSADTTWGGGAMHVDLAVGDASNKDVIIQDMAINFSASEGLMNTNPFVGVERAVPASSTIYARAQFSGTLDTYYICAYGLGG